MLAKRNDRRDVVGDMNDLERGEMPKKFRVAFDVRVKHGDLFCAAQLLGGQAALARRLGVRQADVSAWCNLKSTPKYDSDTWNRIEPILYELTGKHIEELFPESLRQDRELLAAPKRLAVYQDAAIVAGRIECAGPFGSERLIELREKLDRVMGLLSERERQVIEARFGLEGTPKSRAEVARDMGISRERSRQIENRALRKMNHSLQSLEAHEGDDA